jgi:glycerol-3-phosphate acyltransferase PlsX
VNRDISIALDAMGGDVGPSVVVQAAIAAARSHPRLRLILVGRSPDIDPVLSGAGFRSDQILVHHAEQVVGMDESPAAALRSKKDSSMRVAINLVKEGRVDACVSAGNTGALMATARFVLRTLPGIDRPAICTTIPSLRGHTHVLDLGANVDSKSEHLLQFAIMGSELVKAVDDIPQPKVALLNVGQEDIKGNDQVKQAAALLGDSHLNYVGYAEGDGIYTGDHDVVVCDGFVGNVALKSSEGVARMIRKIIRDEFHHNLLTRAAGLAAGPVLKRIATRIDPRQYNGASLLGLSGVVIKSHGDADAFAFEHAIDIAMIEAQKDIPGQIRAQLEIFMLEGQAV